VFKKKNVDTLPKHQLYDYTIDFEKGTQPPSRPIYNLSQDKVTMFREYIYENLEKRFIRHSKFIVGILFVNKKYGFLCTCVDYHGLNQLNINN
jgi:hypothetical protein